MGGSDFYCSVSGARYFASTDEFATEISSSSSDSPPLYLNYSEEDVQSSCTYILLCPYKTLQDGTTIKFYTQFDDPHPTEYSESTITQIFNVFPGDNPELGDYQSRAISGEPFFSVLPCGNTLLITYTSYLILKQAAPEVKPHILYALAYGGNRDTMGEVAGIDYGPVGRIFGQYAYWAGICGGGGGEGGFEDPGVFWQRLLQNAEGRAEEDIVYDAWKGPGNMWVFVRPDRFPIPETLAATLPPNFPYPITTEKTIQNSKKPTLTSLPPDILLSTCHFLSTKSISALTTTCKRLRSLILPHADGFARRRIVNDEPWFLPAGSFELNPTTTTITTTTKNPQEMHGHQEIEWWTAQWAVGGISGDDRDTRIPWFVYRRECSKSMSMWNRKRIWGIARQLDALARVKGLLP